MKRVGQVLALSAMGLLAAGNVSEARAASATECDYHWGVYCYSCGSGCTSCMWSVMVVGCTSSCDEQNQMPGPPPPVCGEFEYMTNESSSCGQLSWECRSS